MIGPVKGWRIVAVLAAIALLVGARTAWAAFVTEGSPYATGDDPLLMYSADFNGDSRPDVVALNGSGSSASVFLRQPGGFAQEGAAIPVGTAPSGGAVGDFNGDGRPDLAVASFGAGTVTVLLRQPGGGFAQGMGSPINVGGGSLGAIAAGDFNGDGSIDLAATRYSLNSVAILLNTGAGFSNQLNFATGATPRTVVAGNFNGDSSLDLATTNIGDNTVTVALGPIFTTEPNI